MGTITFQPTTKNQSLSWNDDAIWLPSLVPNGPDVDVVLPTIYLGQNPYGYYITVEEGDAYTIQSLDMEAQTLQVVGALTVNGDLDEQSSAGLDMQGGTLSVGSLALQGYGLAGTGVVNDSNPLVVSNLLEGSGLTVNAAGLTNNGSLVADGGTLAITTEPGGFTNDAAGVLTGGTYSAYSSESSIDASMLLINDGDVLTVDAANIFIGSFGDVEFFNPATKNYAPIQSTLTTIAPEGSLTIAANTAQFGVLVDNGQISLDDDDVNFAPTGLTIGDTGSLIGSGTLSTPTVNNGIIGGFSNLVIDSTVTGEGNFEIDGKVTYVLEVPFFVGGSLEFTGPQSEDVVFEDGAGILTLDAPGSFTGSIVAKSFLTGSYVGIPEYSSFSILLKGVSYNSVTGYSFDADLNGGVLSIDTANAEYNYKFIGNLQLSNFTLQQGYSLSTVPLLDITVTGGVPCFLGDTLIATPQGGLAIRDLRVGDFVLTASGRLRPIIWIGRRPIDISKHAAPHDIWPVRVSAAHAFGKNLPRRDLWLSPGHSIAFKNVLIPISALINGRSVAQIEKKHVEYWHVELDAHDIVIAEGLPTESYLDCGNRTAFANGSSFVEAHPDFRPKHWAETCLPVTKDGPVVAVAKAHLLARLHEQGYLVDREAGAHIIVDGRRIEPRKLSESSLSFTLPTGARKIVLHSKVFVPA